MTGVTATGEHRLSSGATVSVDEHRVRLDLPPGACSCISSAIVNGGHRHLPSLNVLNYRVPSDYNGYDPTPEDLLSGFATREGLQKGQIIGLLTAASMKTFSKASRSYQGIDVDVVVTSGLSNSRAAGAEADYFVLCENEGSGESSDDGGADGDQRSGANPIKPGTINTVVITNATLTPAALVEAYAIAIEAKCRACANHSVTCAKSPSELAQGTGTDCCVLIAASETVAGAGANSNPRRVKHAGKHTLFAEMVGQAVEEATSASIMINIRHTHGNFVRYKLHRIAASLWATFQGARPCVPPRPMMPVPNAPPSVLAMGMSLTCASYLLTSSKSVALLLGAVFWDRYLGEPPLLVHPVVIAGNFISKVLSILPKGIYQSASLGFLCGMALLLSMVTVFTSVGWVFLRATERLPDYAVQLVALVAPRFSSSFIAIAKFFDFFGWILRLLLVKSTFSIQLLCTLALQMAKFLERKQLGDARAQLSWLCSRSPSNLSADELAGATLESLAENISDGFVAPIFWYSLLGPLGSLAYRVVNTLDSRVGYRGKYEYLGKASARCDDVLNLVPARLTCVFLALAATFVTDCSGSDGIKTAISDRKQCDSPNAGWPMASMAGLLGVRLEKKGEYCLGAGPPPNHQALKLGFKVSQLTGGIALVIAILYLLIRES